jgi:hypothetical protein
LANDDYDREFDFSELPYDEQQDHLYGIIGFADDPENQQVHDLFWDVMYNDELSRDEREAMYDELASILWEEYGLDFEDLWDWEDFRAWYDAA